MTPNSSLALRMTGLRRVVTPQVLEWLPVRTTGRWMSSRRRPRNRPCRRRPSGFGAGRFGSASCRLPFRLRSATRLPEKSMSSCEIVCRLQVHPELDGGTKECQGAHRGIDSKRGLALQPVLGEQRGCSTGAAQGHDLGVNDNVSGGSLFENRFAQPLRAAGIRHENRDIVRQQQPRQAFAAQCGGSPCTLAGGGVTWPASAARFRIRVAMLPRGFVAAGSGEGR